MDVKGLLGVKTSGICSGSKIYRKVSLLSSWPVQLPDEQISTVSKVEQSFISLPSIKGGAYQTESVALKPHF